MITRGGCSSARVRRHSDRPSSSGRCRSIERDRGLEVGDRLEPLARRGGGGDDGQARLVVDQATQAGPHCGVVVDDDEVHPMSLQ